MIEIYAAMPLLRTRMIETHHVVMCSALRLGSAAAAVVKAIVRVIVMRFATGEPASLPTLTLQDLLHKIHNGKTAHLLCRTIELTGPPETRTIVTKPLCIF